MKPPPPGRRGRGVKRGPRRPRSPAAGRGAGKTPPGGVGINPFGVEIRAQVRPGRGVVRATLQLSLLPEARGLRGRYRALLACYPAVAPPVWFDLGREGDGVLEVPCSGPPPEHLVTTVFGVAPDGRVELVFRNWGEDAPPPPARVRRAEGWTPGRVLEAFRAGPEEVSPDLARAARRFFGGKGPAALCAGVPVEQVPRPWLGGRTAVALAAAQLHLRLQSGRREVLRLGLGWLVRRARRLGLGWREALAEGLRLREEYPGRPPLAAPVEPPAPSVQEGPPPGAGAGRLADSPPRPTEHEAPLPAPPARRGRPRPGPVAREAGPSGDGAPPPEPRPVAEEAGPPPPAGESRPGSPGDGPPKAPSVARPSLVETGAPSAADMVLPPGLATPAARAPLPGLARDLLGAGSPTAGPDLPPVPASGSARLAPVGAAPWPGPGPQEPPPVRPVRWSRRIDREQAAALAVPENLPGFLAELDHPDNLERWAAAVLAAATGSPEAVVPLAGRLHVEPDPSVLRAVLAALGRLGPEGRDALEDAARQEGALGLQAIRALYGATADPGRRPALLARMARLAADATLRGPLRAVAGQAVAEWGWISEEEAAAAGLSAGPEASRPMLPAWRAQHGAPLVDRRLGWELIAERPALGFFPPPSVHPGLVRLADALSGLDGPERALVEEVTRVLLEREAVLAARATAGRNEPCPCGSGAKFKKCCGSAAGRSALDPWVPLRERPGIPLAGMRVAPHDQPEAPHLLQAMLDGRLRPPAGCRPYHRWFLACRAMFLKQDALATDLGLEVLADWGADERLDYLRILHLASDPVKAAPLARLEALMEAVATRGCPPALHLLANLLAGRADRGEALPRLGDRVLEARAAEGDALAAFLVVAVDAPGIPVPWLLGLRERLAQPTESGATLDDLRTLVDEAAGVVVWFAPPVPPPRKELGPEQAPWLYHPWEGMAGINLENHHAKLGMYAFTRPLEPPGGVSPDSVEPLAREAAARQERVDQLRVLYKDIRRRAGEHEQEVVGRRGEAGFYGAVGDTLNLLLPRTGPLLRCLAAAAAAGRLAAELDLEVLGPEFRGGRPVLRVQGERKLGDEEEHGFVVMTQEVAAELGVEPAPFYNLLLGELDLYRPDDGAGLEWGEGVLAREAARRGLHPLALAAEVGRQREAMDFWLGDVDLAVPLEPAEGVLEVAPPEPAPGPSSGPADDPLPLRRYLRRACQRILRMGKIGESHTAFDHLGKGIPKHLRGEARDFFEAMVTAGMLRDKPTHYGRQVSVEPRAVPALQRFVEDGSVPEALRRAFTREG